MSETYLAETYLPTRNSPALGTRVKIFYDCCHRKRAFHARCKRAVYPPPWQP